jgi:hypothetical protein
VGFDAGCAEKIAGMIDGHQNHDDATKQVQGFDARAFDAAGLVNVVIRTVV